MCRTDIGYFAMKEWLKDLRRSLSPDLPWMNRDGLQQAYTVIALAFITGIMPMPYEFYTTLRVVVCVFLWRFFTATKSTDNKFSRDHLLIIGMLILYNPLIPFHFGEKPIWTIVNAISLYLLFRLRRKLGTKPNPEGL